MRKAVLLSLTIALLSSGGVHAVAQPGVPGGPEVLRGVIVSPGKADVATQAAFSDALLDLLADRTQGQATLLSPEAALCRVAGITAVHFAALAEAPPEQAGALLLLWAQRLYLSEVCRLTLASTPEGVQAELLQGRLALGQVRRTLVTLTQPLTKTNAPLLAGKVAQTIKSGWETASTVTSSGLPPGPAVVPVVPPTPSAPTPPPPVARPATTATTPPTEGGLLAAARVKLQEGDAARALDLIAQALQAGENRTQALLLRAQCYAALRALDLQREALAAAIAGDNTLYEPRLQLAALERDRGLWQTAVGLYRDAISAQPAQTAAYVALASLYRDQRRPAEALKTLQEGVQAAPQSLSLLFVLAEEYQRRGTLPAAEETYAKIAALAHGPQKAEALQELGRIYINAGQYGAAFEALKEAAQYSLAEQAQRYTELFVACDKAVGQSLEAAFQALEALDSPTKPAPREEVFQRLATAGAQVKKITDFAGPLQLPAEQQSALEDRQLYYSRAAEAITYALEYVDTGNAAAKATALERRKEAAGMPAGWGG